MKTQLALLIVVALVLTVTAVAAARGIQPPDPIYPRIEGQPFAP